MPIHLSCPSRGIAAHAMQITDQTEMFSLRQECYIFLYMRSELTECSCSFPGVVAHACNPPKLSSETKEQT